MSTKLDTKLGSVAKRLLTKFGKVITVRQFPSLSYDPTTLRTSEGSPSAYSVKATPPAPFSNRLVDGERVMVGDVHVMIAADGLTFTPDPSDELVIDSVTWKVVNVSPLYSGEDVAAWQYQARR